MEERADSPARPTCAPFLRLERGVKCAICAHGGLSLSRVLFSVPRSCCGSAGVRECECMGGTVCMGCACVTQSDVQCCDDGCSGQRSVCAPLETVTMAQWFDVLVERSPSLALKRVTDCLVAAPVPVCAHVQSCMIMPEETRDPDHSGRSTRHRAGGGVCVLSLIHI